MSALTVGNNRLQVGIDLVQYHQRIPWISAREWPLPVA